MAQCFCGCGERVGGFQMQRKSANKMGGTVTDTLEQMQRDVLRVMEERAEHLAPGEGEKGLAMARERIAAGKRYSRTCRAVVHEEQAFADADWPEMRAWVRDAQGMAAMFRLPPEQQQRIIDRG